MNPLYRWRRARPVVILGSRRGGESTAGPVGGDFSVISTKNYEKRTQGKQKILTSHLVGWGGKEDII